MAKEQNLSLNPTKISGICGRLMCCLNYEQDIYEEIRKKLPKIGSIVDTPYGEGEVISNSVIKESVKVKVRIKDGEDELKVVKIEDLTLISGSYEDIINDVDIKELEGQVEDPDMIKELFKEN